LSVQLKQVSGTTAIRRDGLRDIVFVGALIGRGEAANYIAEVYKTTSGKYVASLVGGDPYGKTRKHQGIVSKDAEGIAQFFEQTIETDTFLNEAGKLAMQNASATDPSFLDKGFEIVE